MDYIIFGEAELARMGLRKGPIEYDVLIESLPTRVRDLFRRLEKLPPVKQYLTEDAYKETAENLRFSRHAS